MAIWHLKQVVPHLNHIFLTQGDLNDLSVILNLCKNPAELLGFRPVKGGIFSTTILKYISLAIAKMDIKNFSLKNWSSILWRCLLTYVGSYTIQLNGIRLLVLQKLL
jgi:hypothetical protein